MMRRARLTSFEPRHIVIHSYLDNKALAEVPIKHGAAVVAVSMIEPALNEWAKPEANGGF
jgi:hypothetical protein